MSYDSKIDRAKSLLAEHNRALPSDVMKVNVDTFITCLVTAGGTNDTGLQQCSWEDLQGMGVPKLLAKQIATMFREGDTSTAPSGFVSARAAERMTLRELIQKYDVTEADNAVGSRLLALSKGKKFIVFADYGVVNVEASELLLKEIRSGYEERNVYVTDRPRATYRIGERESVFFDENPIYKGETLFLDGTCARTNRSWAQVSQFKRTLARLALDSGELKLTCLDDAHKILDTVMTLSEQELRVRYSKASLLFDKLALEGKLPSLKLNKASSIGVPLTAGFGLHKTGAVRLDPFFSSSTGK